MSRKTTRLVIILGISIISFTACSARKEVIQEEAAQEEKIFKVSGQRHSKMPLFSKKGKFL